MTTSVLTTIRPWWRSQVQMELFDPLSYDMNWPFAQNLVLGGHTALTWGEVWLDRPRRALEEARVAAGKAAAAVKRQLPHAALVDILDAARSAAQPASCPMNTDVTWDAIEMVAADAMLGIATLDLAGTEAGYSIRHCRLLTVAWDTARGLM